MSVVNYSYLIGIATIIVIWIIYAVVNKNWNPTKLYEGADGKSSTSKFQWWLWIIVIIFTYITIYAARSIAQGGVANPISDIPSNVLAVLGFSTLTTAISKGVTQGYVTAGLVAKTTSDGANKKGGLVQDDSGVPDLYKMQIFFWTLIAVFIYLASLFGIIAKAAAASDASAAADLLTFPDIDTSLMVLSGLSAGGYIGKKIVTKDAPKITIDSITPTKAQAGEDLPIVVLGTTFGKDKNDSMFNFGKYINHATTSWTNNEIRATIPSIIPKGVYQVSVIVGGLKSNEVSFELT